VEPIQLAAVLAAIVLVASMASVELGVTVALIELTLPGARLVGPRLAHRRHRPLDDLARRRLRRPRRARPQRHPHRQAADECHP
jgi:hypothetical protein